MAHDMTMNREGDLVLIYYQDKPSIYARIERIEPDIKKDWYQVRLLLLAIPPAYATWILREEYIHGGTFTMGGVPMKLEGIKAPAEGQTPTESGTSPSQKEGGRSAKVIPFKKEP